MKSKWIALALVLLILGGCAKDIESGKKAIVNIDSPIADNLDDYNEVMQYYDEGNEDAFNSMHNKGRAGILSKGTEVTVVEAYGSVGSHASKIMLPDGRYAWIDDDDLDGE